MSFGRTWRFVNFTGSCPGARRATALVIATRTQHATVTRRMVPSTGTMACPRCTEADTRGQPAEDGANRSQPGSVREFLRQFDELAIRSELAILPPVRFGLRRAAQLLERHREIEVRLRVA